MPDTRPPTLDYAGPELTRPRPTHHSALAGWAWAALIVEAIYRASVVAYAYYRSPTYPWERFERNVGDRGLFIMIDCAIVVVGMALAIAALIPSNRKRWAAWLALAGSLLLLAKTGGLIRD